MLPEFPKKKLLALSPAEIEQRRVMLERYIQLGEMIVYSWFILELASLFSENYFFI